MKITDCLAIEHQVFSDIVGLIEEAMGNPQRYPDAALRAMVEALAVPLERHARMEEEVLFPALEAYIERTTGPLAVMDAEHESIRESLTTISAGQGIRGQTTRLLATLRGHIHKEDRVLFPMAQEFLGTEALSHLAKECSTR